MNPCDVVMKVFLQYDVFISMIYKSQGTSVSVHGFDLLHVYDLSSWRISFSKLLRHILMRFLWNSESYGFKSGSCLEMVLTPRRS
jgi:hypothetical protein